MIRIIAGSLRSRLIKVPNIDATRPTKDRVREAIFSAISGNITDATVLDLFAGSGAFGLEALSRQAKFVYSNDKHPLAYQTIFENCQSLNLTNRVKLTRLDFKKAIESYGEQKLKFDIIFIDPPYQTEYALQALTAIQQHQLIAPRGIIILESDRECMFPTNLAMSKTKTYDYGDTYVTIGWTL
jgi:16S rRNA (guanine(966)-N(2))-methyltransferase RsmD